MATAGLANPQPLMAGAVLREVWEGIPGTAVSDLTSSPDFPNNPTSSNLVTDYLEAPTDIMDNYGQRMHGYVVPPASGNYRFWIASDDASELWLGSNADPATRKLIAYVSGWTSSRAWTTEANQQSGLVALTAGTPYYIAALQKEGGGGDNLAVRWVRPDGVDEGPIPATYLLPYGTSFTAPLITQQPANCTVVEGQTATFTVGVTNLDQINFRWQQNGQDIPGANGASLNLKPVPLSANNSQFRAFLSNQLGSTNSDIAVLTVIPDTTRPTLAKALNQGRTTILLTFSEPVGVLGATALGNYSISGGINLIYAAMGADDQTVVLTTSALVYGASYTIAVSGVNDRAATPNPILPGAQITFTAVEYVPFDVGAPALAGGSMSVAGGLDVTGGGKTIGGTSDQFQMSWQQKTGDFDIQARVAQVSLPDPYMRAGLMLRETLDSTARFGAVFAGSPQLGCFFESRSTLASAATLVAPTGGFPANYPYTWLRLKRQGATVSGYASPDAQTWTSLGAAALSGLPSTAYFGFAVSGDSTNAVATAQFRDIGPAQSTATGTFTPTKEPLGPSSRACSLIISEIMYHPALRTDGRNLEFIELANARSVPEDLTGWRVSGDVDYTFPSGFRLLAGEFVVIAAVPDDIKAIYGITNVLGPYTGSLPGNSGTIRLRNNADAVRLELTYSDAPPWPVAPDGSGHSLVLARPSLGEADPAAWSSSEFIGGSPGGMDPTVPDPLKNVVINEFLAHTDPPAIDYIELYNHSNASINLSGCWLSDDPSTNKFRVPPGTTLAARGFVSYTSEQLGFRLNAAGETLYFVSPDQKRVLDCVHFGGQENGVSTGRYPDGDPVLRRLARPTPGGANAPWRLESVVINEIMYAPISGDAADQYVELYNRSSSPVNLSGWKFTHGIDFTFPQNVTLPAQGYLVVANNAAHLLANYRQLNSVNTAGDFNGKLSNNGDRLVLTQPHWLMGTNDSGVLSSNLIRIAVAEVSYGIGGRWGQWANGGGSSLELIDPDADALRAANWADSDETAKAPWTSVSVTNRLDNGDSNFSPNRLRIAMQGPGECLVDDVEVFRDGSTNLVTNGNFENGATGWSFFGNHSSSTVDSAGAANGTGCLHVRGQDGGDTGVNGIRKPLIAGLTANATGVIRAKVRWLRGWPEVLFRLQGNYLELPARMTIPANLGTPGQPNSRLVNNAGPAIFDVSHDPPLPRANEAVRVTCRVSDPDGIASVQLQYRLDSSSSLVSVPMNDTGTSGDEIAQDGVYTATIPAPTTGQLVAFRIVAADGTATPATSVFPAGAPAQECLVRWNDTVPFGTFPHYHLWSTTATEQARNKSIGLDNTWRDATLVYGNYRVIYNCGFRDKGSPYHSGTGDMVVNVPEDDLLLGTTERNFASTGNGGQEATDIRSQTAAWLAQELEIPYLHAHYVRLYRNGGLFRSVSEDLEVPNRAYAKRWFPDGGRGDFYKISVWFEFRDDNLSFNATGCTLQRFMTLGPAFKLARYRWNWERRPDGGTANNYTNIFDLVDAANDGTSNYATRMLSLADMEEWMRVFAFHRIMGNWDSWTYNVGQNMYALKQPGVPWKLIPWDIDFTFGLGDGPTSALGGGSFGGNSQDPVGNKFYNTAAFRRMLWRAYQDALAGPLLPENYSPQIAARRSILVKNQVTDASDPRGIGTYIDQRRTYIQKQLAANDAKLFAITSNGGADFDSSTPTTTLQGTAPFAVATIEINGVPYPLTWSGPTVFQVTVPLPLATNALVLVGKDRHGAVVPGATASVNVTYSGVIPRVEDNVSLNEIQYNPAVAGASFVELFNRSTFVPFDLTNFRLDGVKYVFPPGAIIQPNTYLLVVKDKAVFSKTYGATVRVFDAFPGSLDNNGEHVALVKPGATPAEDQIISDVRYQSQLPWPTNAAGFGPSLQLIDWAQDTYRVGNWTATAPNDPNRATPGRANALVQSLPPFPPVWINEVQALNNGAVVDNSGQADPWIELYNSGSAPVDLSPYYLSDDYSNLAKWPFPAGSSIGAHQFLLIWADGQTGQANSQALHTSFRLSNTNGSVALVRLQGAPVQPAVMDFLDYPALSAGRSYGCLPNGQPRQRQLFDHATPNAPNDGVWPQVQVTINELMASNTHGLLDPVTGADEGWFELHNAGSTPVDLSSYVLRNSLTNGNGFSVPPGTIIPPAGFLICWADNQSASSLDASGAVHVPFKLTKSGGDLALLDPSGKAVDSLVYGPQADDVSVGRFPDGADLPLLTLDKATPGSANYVAGANRPPVFAPLGPQTVAEGTTLQFAVTATDPDEGQSISYSLDPDAPAGMMMSPQAGVIVWTPSEADGPGSLTLNVHATDSGTPPRTTTLHVTINVTEVNLPPQIEGVVPQSVQQGQTLEVQVHATDPDIPANQLTYSLDGGAPEGAVIDASTGLFTWTPSFSEALGNYSITARVTDNGLPPLSATATFTVNVLSGPKPPILDTILPVSINELTPWQITAHAADPATPPSPILYSLDIAPEGAQIASDTGMITWTPSEAQGPTNAVFVVRATLSAPPNLSSTATFGVNVLEVNQAPSLAPVPDQIISAGETWQYTGTATDADLPANSLTYSLGLGAPAGMTIAPTTGRLTWTPTTSQIPSTNQVTVLVTDDGSPPLNASRTFNVVVRRAAPWKFVSATGTASSSTVYIYLTAPGEVFIDDLTIVPGDQAGTGTNVLNNGDFESALTGPWTVSANLASSAIQSSVKHSGQGALHVVAASAGTTRASSIYQDITPALVSNDPYTLSFWYLPGTNNTSLTVRLSGNGITSVTPVAALINAAPILASIPDRVLTLGETLSFTAAASDPDFNYQELAFTLDPPTPNGATLDPFTGAFVWTPGNSQAPSTNVITVRVTDNGRPPKSDFQSFTVVVRQPGVGEISVALTHDGLPVFTWDSQPGRKYRVEFKDSLADTLWQSYPEIAATLPRTTFQDAAAHDVPQRYYRIVLLP